MSTDTTVSPKIRNKLYNNPQLCRDLPRPNEEWPIRDTDINSRLAQPLRNMGIIERVSRPTKERSAVWRTDPYVDEWIEERDLRDPERAPRYLGDGDVSTDCPECSSCSFINEAETDGLTCKRCDTVSPKTAWSGGEPDE